MIDIEIFFVADRSAKVEALLLPNQIYIYICKYSRSSFRYCLATYAFNSSTALQSTRGNFPLSFSNTSPSPPPLIERRSTRGHVIGRPFGLIVPSTSQLTFIRPILTLGSDHRRIVCIASFRDFTQDFFSPSSPPLGYFSKFTLTAALSPNFVPKLPYIPRHRCSRRAVPLVFLVEVERRRRGEGGGHGSCRAMFRRGGRRKTVVRHRAAARLRAQ